MGEIDRTIVKIVAIYPRMPNSHPVASPTRQIAYLFSPPKCAIDPQALTRLPEQTICNVVSRLALSDLVAETPRAAWHSADILPAEGDFCFSGELELGLLRQAIAVPHSFGTPAKNKLAQGAERRARELPALGLMPVAAHRLQHCRPSPCEQRK